MLLHPAGRKYVNYGYILNIAPIVYLLKMLPHPAGRKYVNHIHTEYCTQRISLQENGIQEPQKTIITGHPHNNKCLDNTGKEGISQCSWSAVI
jgi:hypothetical protein